VVAAATNYSESFFIASWQSKQANMTTVPDKQREKRRMWRLAGRYSSVGIELAAAITFGTLIGAWLDDHFDSTPWGIGFGLVVGIGAAIKTLRRVISRAKDDGLI